MTNGAVSTPQVTAITAIGFHRVAKAFHIAASRSAIFDAAAKIGDAPMSWILIASTDCKLIERRESTL
jgi:hypothetical protein